MKRMLSEAWRLLVLALRYRRVLTIARVSTYARVALGATQLVEKMRARYPGRNFMWSFPTNHVLDSEGEYVLVWRISNSGVISMPPRFVFKGPLRLMSRLVDEGEFDGHRATLPEEGC
jgi:hypothetical protein